MSDKIWHIELVSTDKIAAAKWYSDLFGWQVEHFEEMDYIQVRSGPTEPTLAFSPVNAEQGMPKLGALVYVDTADVDALMSRAQELGGAILMDKMEIPTVGWMTTIGDPYGNRIAAMQRAYPDPESKVQVTMLREQIKRASETLQGYDGRGFS